MSATFGATTRGLRGDAPALTTRTRTTPCTSAFESSKHRIVGSIDAVVEFARALALRGRIVASREKPLVWSFSPTIVEVASASRSFLTNTQVARVPKGTMSRASAHALALVLSLAVLVSGVQAQTKPTDAVGTNALPVYSITTDEWSDDVLDDPSETVVAVTSAGSCVCDLTEGACDGNCCCDPDCTVRARRLVLRFSSPRRQPTSRFVSVFSCAPHAFRADPSRSLHVPRAFAVHRARAVHRALGR